MSEHPGAPSQRDLDQQELQRLGYAQQLLRDLGGFQNFALSFSIISILTGAVTLYGYGLKMGGPFEMAVGWPLVAGLTLFVALSLAELASAFPTAGALYHWSSMLGGKGVGWATAWLNTLGQFAITAAIDYGLAEFLAPMLGLEAQRSTVLWLYAGVLFTHGLFNHFGVRAVAKLNTVSAWYHLVGVAVLVGAVLLLAPKQPVGFLFQRFTTAPEGLAVGFLLGLLQAGWTFTGYDASAHVSEETVDPGRVAPRGIVLSVAVSGVAGWLMLGAVTLAISDLPQTVAAANPFIHVLKGALGSLGDALVWMVLGAMWFCGLSSVTSNSRMLFAFARDGGLPMSKRVASVSHRFQSPHVAVWLSVAMALLVALWADAYSAMTALSTIALYASYALPIAVGLRARQKGVWKERGPWHLGRWSTAVNVVALAWCAVLTVLLVLPPNQLAGYTFGGTCVLLVVAWWGGVRKVFEGPRVTLVRRG